jgi:hypothetical protein
MLTVEVDQGLGPASTRFLFSCLSCEQRLGRIMAQHEEEVEQDLSHIHWSVLHNSTVVWFTPRLLTPWSQVMARSDRCASRVLP